MMSCTYWLCNLLMQKEEKYSFKDLKTKYEGFFRFYVGPLCLLIVPQPNLSSSNTYNSFFYYRYHCYLAWINKSEPIEMDPLLQCRCNHESTQQLKAARVFHPEKLVWIILKFMSAHVHVSAPGNGKFKATPASHFTYGQYRSTYSTFSSHG